MKCCEEYYCLILVFKIINYIFTTFIDFPILSNKGFAFLPSKLCDDEDEMPKYYGDKTKYISTIQPFTTRSRLEIGLFFIDMNAHNKIDEYRGVNIAQNGDDIVDFTDDFWLNKIIKYMQDAIKK